MAETDVHWKPMLVGGAAGLVAETLVFPISTIITRVQSSVPFYQTGGFKHLYRGLSSVLVSTLPSTSSFFFVYEYAKQKQQPGTRNHLVSASVAEFFSCGILAPAEAIRQRAQTSRLSLPNIIFTFFHSRKDVWQSFKGMAIRNVPATAFQFVLYENFKSKFTASDKLFGAPKGAALSGAITAALLTPLDVIKTQINLQPDDYKTTIRRIYQLHGAFGFFKGLTLRVFAASLGLSIYLGTYEYFKSHFRIKRLRDARFE
ncbi:tricarboxylate transporter [Schizosaccharomyces cryophilus OY26]|uniref:Tricarboxylate transporter n=1 Tax=Schizosaccharomyces cryophilus (strain OY26 / ATCC MYA-4695 / CBS 11777 / NBRC 106824 / NRRL Y48691) TaxID=653667 RepID=S9W3L3_SCHCR|nr:tricarboxylate transporter [Schizosaccharomyces cryophilus OY26]EPY53134.1 tricarboxylate transporter [Schizosaccharomyces cryophilus OY26]